MSTSLVNKEAVALRVLGGPTEAQPLLSGRKKNCECSTRAKVCSVALVVLAAAAAIVLVTLLSHCSKTGSSPAPGGNSTWVNLTGCSGNDWPRPIP